jgi:hypothetical protein
MQDIQTLVRISRQPFYRLVFRGEEVEEREVCDEDDSTAVGKDEEVHEGEWHAVQVVEDVQGYPSDDKERDGVCREGLVDDGDARGLVLEERFDKVVWSPYSKSLSLRTRSLGDGKERA